MGFSGIALALMLICVQSAFGEIEVFPGEPFNCNRYTDIVLKEWTCRPDGLFEISDDVTDDGILTREELLGEVSAQCSNETLLETYFDCLEELVVECPVQSIIVLDVIQEKLGMFCDGTRVSEWLLSAVQSGYTYNHECAEVSRVLVAACAKEVSATYTHIISNYTLMMALEVLQPAVSDLFQCTENKFSMIPAPYQECGSSWQDMLLTAWLQISASTGLGGHLSPEDRLQLQDLRYGQNVHVQRDLKSAKGNGQTSKSISSVHSRNVLEMLKRVFQ